MGYIILASARLDDEDRINYIKSMNTERGTCNRIGSRHGCRSKTIIARLCISIEPGEISLPPSRNWQGVSTCET